MWSAAVFRGEGARLMWLSEKLDEIELRCREKQGMREECNF
jgi:hypothetical protein